MTGIVSLKDEQGPNQLGGSPTLLLGCVQEITEGGISLLVSPTTATSYLGS
jgi:hypothetical protein